MDTVLGAARMALWILGIWTAVSFVAVIPVLALFRGQARRNALRTRDDRRRAWSMAAGRRVVAR